MSPKGGQGQGGVCGLTGTNAYWKHRNQFAVVAGGFLLSRKEIPVVIFLKNPG